MVRIETEKQLFSDLHRRFPLAVAATRDQCLDNSGITKRGNAFFRALY